MSKRYYATDGRLFLILKADERGNFDVTSPFEPQLRMNAASLNEAFAGARDVIKMLGAKRRASIRKTLPNAIVNGNVQVHSARSRKRRA